MQVRFTNRQALVNHGEFASPDDAETFGNMTPGRSQDDYYAQLCAPTDGLAAGAGA